MKEVMTERQGSSPLGHFEIDVPGRTPYEAACIRAAIPKLEILHQRYDRGGYHDTLATLRPDQCIDVGLALSVFRVFHKGRPVIVRRPKTEEQSGEIITRASALALGMGMDRLEQPLAVSFPDKAIFSSVLPGKESEYLTEEEIRAILESDIKNVVPVFEQARRKGLGFDLGAGNIFYDPQYGYSFTDYGLQSRASNSIAERTFAVFLYKPGYERHSAFFTASQQQAWRSLIPDPLRTFEEVYPGRGHIFEQTVQDYN